MVNPARRLRYRRSLPRVRDGDGTGDGELPALERQAAGGARRAPGVCSPPRGGTPGWPSGSWPLLRRRIAPSEEPLHLVHRLDVTTSGVVLLTRDRETHRALVAASRSGNSPVTRGGWTSAAAGGEGTSARPDRRTGGECVRPRGTAGAGHYRLLAAAPMALLRARRGPGVRTSCASTSRHRAPLVGDDPTAAAPSRSNAICASNAGPRSPPRLGRLPAPPLAVPLTTRRRRPSRPVRPAGRENPCNAGVLVETANPSDPEPLFLFSTEILAPFPGPARASTVQKNKALPFARGMRWPCRDHGHFKLSSKEQA